MSEPEELEVCRTYKNVQCHRRRVDAIERHFGVLQVKCYDLFCGKTVWESISEFRAWLVGKTFRELCRANEAN